MTEFEDAIVQKLIADGICSALGTDVFSGRKARIPSGDGPYVSVVSYSGAEFKGTHTTDYSGPSAQIVVRASKASDAKTKSREIFSAFVRVSNITLSGDFYQWIRAKQEPFDLPEDEQGRARRAFNVEAMRTIS